MKISKHISYEEATRSDTAERIGLNNLPGEMELASMTAVAENVFEPLRAHFCVPIGITSFYRSKALNTAIGGAGSSQHILGQAIDLDADKYGGITNADIYTYIKDNLEFDTLIWEFGTDKNPAWVHVSYVPGNNRRRLLKAVKDNGRTVYRLIDTRLE